MLLLCLLAGGNGLLAQTDKELGEFVTQLDRIERQLASKTLTSDDNEKLLQWQSMLTGLHSDATKCAADTEIELKKLADSIASLGEKSRNEPKEVARKRVSLNQEKQNLDNRLSRCKLLLLRGEETAKLLGELQKQLLAQQMFARGPGFFTLLQESGRQPAIWWNTTQGFIAQHSGITRIAPYKLFILVFAAGMMALASFMFRSNILNWAEYKVWSKNYAARVLRAFTYASAAYAPSFFITGMVALVMYGFAYNVSPIPFVNVVLYAMPIYVFLLACIRFVFAPPVPATTFLALDSTLSLSIYRRLRVLLNLFLLAYLLFSTILTQSLPETAILLARGVIGLFLILNLIWVVLLLGQLPRYKNRYWPRYLLFILLLSILVAEWLGYRNLALFTLRAVFGSLAVISLFVFLSRLFQDFFSGLDRGQSQWHRTLRYAIGVKHEEHVPGLIWFRLIASLLLWIGMAYLVLNIWSLSDAVAQQIKIALLDGFKLGSLEIIPVRIFLAIVVFAMLYTFSNWLRTRLERTWLIRTRLDRGTREAIVAITGYTLISIAILIVLGIAGVQFTSLAIIAGALSVGIGFGLQNIVNNFVSGLILLFERPIKTGDWIVVGGTEGYVRKIRMRSTQIQTFDRADVIVPNSELIASQVTNWMLQDARGRIHVPVGVAYDSDVDKVQVLMMQAANNHPDIIKHDPETLPTVLFRRFGNSALEFELRAHIVNIDKRLQVISDLNFAIIRLFRENGIEIPYPQQDLHIRNWPGRPDPDERG